MDSNRLYARAYVDDQELLYTRDKKQIEEQIKQRLSRSLADLLVEDMVGRITMRREYDDPNNYYPPLSHYVGRTVYEAECFVLTPEEWKDYQDLKKFQKDMQKFISVGRSNDRSTR